MKTENYVTLFDTKYLPQGIALYNSLVKTRSDFILWIICVDLTCYETLSHLSQHFPKSRLIHLKDHETENYRKLKCDRSIGEYCWTLTPYAFNIVFSLDSGIERLTYLDADLWLRKSPHDIFQELELSQKSVLITDHAYSPEHDQSATSGQYCVQFLTFYRDNTIDIREKWASQCIDWCYAKAEFGKFGDQKYLDVWPEEYSDRVHVLKDEGLLLGPWNATRFPYGRSVAWHFHGLKLFKKPDNNLGLIITTDTYTIPNVAQVNVYKPYIDELIVALELMKPFDILDKFLS